MKVQYGGGLIAGRLICRCVDCNESDICPHIRDSKECKYILSICHDAKNKDVSFVKKLPQTKKNQK